MSTRWKKILLSTAVLFAFPVMGWAQSDEAQAKAVAEVINKTKPSLWINVGGISHHFEDRDQFNQNHPGLGVEYRFNDAWSVMAGQYKNSVSEKSKYITASYTPWSIGQFRFGVAFGAADGYPGLNEGKVFAVLTPLVTYESRYFGLNLLIIPTVGSSVTGALALQFKFKLTEF